MDFIGIIPARYASTRLPGKPLVDIRGKTLIRRVYEQVSNVFDELFVATDDERIASEVKGFGGKVVMTGINHQSGTDRSAEAIEHIMEMTSQSCDVVINLQGDEPLIHPGQIEELKSCFSDDQTQVATLIKRVQNHEEIFNPNYPKVVFDVWGKAIYFSRSPIPYVRNSEKDQWHKDHQFYKHIGIYAYRTEVLQEITKLDITALEKAEALEQNRWIENGYFIKVSESAYENYPVDTPDDLDLIRTFF